MVLHATVLASLRQRNFSDLGGFALVRILMAPLAVSRDKNNVPFTQVIDRLVRVGVRDFDRHADRARVESHQNPDECKAAKVTEISLSKTGKHGGMKHHVTGQFIDSAKNGSMLVSSGDNVLIPDSTTETYQVLEIKERKEGGKKVDIQILDNNAEEVVVTLDCDEKTVEEIQAALDQDGSPTVNITVFSVMGQASITNFTVEKD